MLQFAHDAFMEPLPAMQAADLIAHTIFLKPRATLQLGTGNDPGFFRVRDGCIALTRYMPDGRRQICDIVGPDRMFEFALISQGRCVAEALTYSTIERPPRRALVSIPNEVGRMLDRQQSHALLLGWKTASEKVASALVDLAGQFSRTRGARPSFPVFPTRGDLGDWLGLTLETVSRCLHRFRREKLIAFTRPELIRILDLRELERKSGARS